MQRGPYSGARRAPTVAAPGTADSGEPGRTSGRSDGPRPGPGTSPAASQADPPAAAGRRDRPADDPAVPGLVPAAAGGRRRPALADGRGCGTWPVRRVPGRRDRGYLAAGGLPGRAGCRRSGTSAATSGICGGSRTRSSTWATRSSPGPWPRRSASSWVSHPDAAAGAAAHAGHAGLRARRRSGLLTIVTAGPALLRDVPRRAAVADAEIGAIAAGALLRPVHDAWPGRTGTTSTSRWAAVPAGDAGSSSPAAALGLRRDGVALGLVLGASVLVNQESTVMAALLAAGRPGCRWLVRRPAGRPAAGRCWRPAWSRPWWPARS